jgi:threonine dehydrogenase-like Zn-dependent dehydrogenase
MRSQIYEGAAAVIGDGMVGYWAAQALVYRGSRVCILGKHSCRLDRFLLAPRISLVNVTEDGWFEAVQSWAKVWGASRH